MAWWNFGRSRSTAANGKDGAHVAASGIHAPTGRKGISNKGDRALAWQHLADFTSTRVGIEAFMEPETNVTKPTILLIASDGEWTRRELVTAKEGWDWARKNEIPIYDVQLTGYPQRMRTWNAKQTAMRVREEQRATAARLRKIREQ